MFKVGDKVRISGKTRPSDGIWYEWKTWDEVKNKYIDNIGIIKNPSNMSLGYWYVYQTNKLDYWAFATEDLTLLNETNMNTLEKFKLAFKSEPEKSFRKLGITNGDDLLTSEGQTIFLGWLLEKNKNEFKKEVCDPMLAEQEKEK